MTTDGFVSSQVTVSDMNLEVLDSSESVDRVAADFIAGFARSCPSAVMGFPTGSTPEGCYKLLAGSNTRIFSDVIFQQIDEWVGLKNSSSGTCLHHLKTNLFKPLTVGEDRILKIRSDIDNPKKEAQQVQKKLERAGGLDLCVLGLGLNGHLGLIEPSKNWLPERVNVIKLSESTRNHTMIQHVDIKPTQGITIGIKDILESTAILLIVKGEQKRNILRKVIDSEPTSQLPASYLNGHSGLKTICDVAAFKK